MSRTIVTVTKRAAVYVGALAILIGTGCERRKFASTSAPAIPGEHTLTVGGIEDGVGESKTVRAIDSMHFRVQTSGPKSHVQDLKEVFPVDIYFVVDTSFSMDDEIRAVKAGIQAIADSFQARKIDTMAGFIGFVDSREFMSQNTFPLTKNLSQLMSQIPSKTTGNNDLPESSVMGIRDAVSRLKTEGRPNALKIILLVSDVVGHNGGVATHVGDGNENIQRDCNIDSAAREIQSLVSGLPNQNLFRLVYAVPVLGESDLSERDEEGAKKTCTVQRAAGGQSTYNAKTQMESLGAEITRLTSKNLVQPLTNRSGKMAWPLTGNQLIETLAPLIEQNRPDAKQLSCLATSITATDLSGRSLVNWKSQGGSSLPEYIELKNVYAPQGQTNRWVSGQSQEVTLKITRCCVDRTSSSPNACVIPGYIQTVRHPVKVL